jgi:hypothetical protein
MKKLSYLLLLMLVSINGFTQTDTTIYLHITYDTALTGLLQDSIYVKPVFTDTNVNNILNKYDFTTFKKAVPFSRFADMQHVFELKCNNIYVAEELHVNFPNLFPYYEIVNPPIPTSVRYTPNDWARPGAWYVYPWALDYIYAREAWGLGAKGSSTVIIGISDTYFDLANPDISPKVVAVDDNTPSHPDVGHGNMVAGQAAAASDNSIGYPAVGFDCMMRLTTVRSAPGLLNMAQPGPYKAKIVNASWVTRHSASLDLTSYLYERQIYDEMYENGVITCAGAGNGTGTWSDNYPDHFVYPASYDHVIATTGINGDDCSWVGGSGGGNCDQHNRDLGDQINGVTNHNIRVDIAAPVRRIGGVTYNPAYTGLTDWERYYCHACASGTSAGSPMTAGVLGLMSAANTCLSPYQLEYALKIGAREDIYSISDNAYVASPRRLGAGALDAEEAVGAALGDYKCNDPATQTLTLRVLK